jgi:hypothetical protein
LNHSQVTGNAATQAGGGIASVTFDPSSVAKLTLNNSAVTDNSQSTGPQDNGLGGGGVVSILGTVTLNGSEVYNNKASHVSGAGIVNDGTMALNKSKVTGNTAATEEAYSTPAEP